MVLNEEIIETFKKGERELNNAENFVDIDLPTAANRLYVAGENLAFCILLAIHGSFTRDHGKIWNRIHELYEKGVFKKDFRPVLETSYRLRIKGDYGRDMGVDVVILSKEVVESQISNLKKFLEEVKRILKEKGLEVDNI